MILTALANGLYVLGLFILGLALLWDLVSAGLCVARIETGSGPSAVPAVSWIIYFLWVEVFRGILADLRAGQHSPALLTPRDFRDLALLTAFHLCCQALIPALYAAWGAVRRRGR